MSRQVGFEHLHAGERQAGIELDLLADHRLALHDGLDAVLAGDADDDGDGLFGGGGPRTCRRGAHVGLDSRR